MTIRMLRPSISRIDVRTSAPLPKRADQELLTSEHRKWAAIVKRRAGYRCEWIENGKRCTKAAPEHRVVADHIRERKDGGALLDPANGRCLCVAHNTIKGIAARKARFAQRY